MDECLKKGDWMDALSSSGWIDTLSRGDWMDALSSSGKCMG